MHIPYTYWYGLSALFPPMKDVEYGRMFEVEDHHWLYLGMETITRAILDRHLPPAALRRILDPACGTGAAMANYLPDYGTVTGFDISSLALRSCRVRKLHRLARASDASDLTFARGALDGLFRRVLASEAPLASRYGLPFGLSVVALARKPVGA